MADTPPDPQVKFIPALTALLLCQLAGEALVSFANFLFPLVSFPGPVVGMALLFVLLLLRGGVETSLEATGSAILRNLSLLFVPAAVGIVQQGPLIAEYGLILLATLVFSTVITLIVTATVFTFVAKRLNIGDDDEL